MSVLGQYRHAQQAPEINERVSTPGGATKTSLEPPQPVVGDVPVAEGSAAAAATAEHQGSSSSASARHDGGILASIMTFIQVSYRRRKHATFDTSHAGSPVVSRATQKKSSGDGYVGQPAPIRRLNDRGGVYTKVLSCAASGDPASILTPLFQNSEYKDSYRRE